MSLLKKYFALLIAGGVVWPLGGVQATEGTQLQLPDFQPPQPQQISPQPQDPFLFP